MSKKHKHHPAYWAAVTEVTVSTCKRPGISKAERCANLLKLEECRRSYHPRHRMSWSFQRRRVTCSLVQDVLPIYAAAVARNKKSFSLVLIIQLVHSTFNIELNGKLWATGRCVDSFD